MSFQFKLQTLLKHNKRLEDMAQIQYAKALSKVKDVEAEISNLYESIKTVRTDISEIERKGGSIQGHVQIRHLSIMGSHKKIEEKKSKLQELNEELERQREILVFAVQEHKKIVILRDKSFENYKKKRKKKEMSQLDDIIVMTHKNKFY